MTDPTKVQTLSEQYPLCAKAGLTLCFNMYSGDNIPAEEVERMLKSLMPKIVTVYDDAE